MEEEEGGGDSFTKVVGGDYYAISEFDGYDRGSCYHGRLSMLYRAGGAKI